MLSISVCWFIRLNNEFAFPDPEPPNVNNMHGWSWISDQFGLCYFVSAFTTSSKLIIFCSILLLHLISSLSLTKYLLVPFACVFIEWIDCVLLSSFELKTILLISFVKTLLNLYCIFNIDLLFFIHSLWFSLSLSMSILLFSRWFILFSSWVVSTAYIIFKFKFSFHDTLFCAFRLFIFTTIIY